MIFKRRKAEPGPEPQIVSIAWGGYYASQRPEGDWGIIRLLDFNTYAYHCSGYRERFPTIPTLDECVAIAPFIGHMPMAASQMVTTPMQLVAAAELTEDDLYGYRVFLEAHDTTGPELEHFIAKMIHYSMQPPIQFQMSLDQDGALQVEQV